MEPTYAVAPPVQGRVKLNHILSLAKKMNGEESRIRPRRNRDSAPLSPGQESLWLLNKVNPAAAYNVPIALRLEGSLQVAALERALGEVIRRHEALRTTLVEIDNTPRQVIEAFRGFSLPVEDFSSLDPAGAEAEIQRCASEEADRPFDLAAGPLLRTKLLRLSGEDHVLLVSMHHAITDGWSTRLFLREIGHLYQAYCQGGESPLPELTVQYGDYALWEREQHQGESFQREIAYWKEQLAGAPALIDLPTDRPRPRLQSFRGARQHFEFPLALLHRLRALGRGEQATLFMVLLAAWQALLAKYTGGDDLSIGTPTAGRTCREIEDLIGCFVNTLVMRTRVTGDLSFRQLLAQVRLVALSAYEHQEFPFEKLVSELQPDRSLSHSPLFQVMFQLDERGGGGLSLPGLRLRPLPLKLQTAKYDLIASLAAHQQGLGLSLTYSADLFDEATIDRMAAHFECLLEQLTSNPDRRLSEVHLMDGRERRQVLVDWNQTERPYPSEKCIHELLQLESENAPDRIAVVCDRQSLSYGELNRRANRVANYLLRWGVRPDSRVGVLVDRGLQLIVTITGILKAGGAYLPLDPNYPPDRLALMLEDAGVEVVITDERWRAALPVTAQVAVITLEGAAAQISGESAEAPEVAVGPTNLCYAMYTSGSTGKPKGVAIEHRSVIRLVRGANYADLAPEDVILHAARFPFDASTFEIWGPLLNGGRVVIMAEANPSVEELGGAINRYGITALWLTTGLFQAMVESRLEDFGGVRELLAGGDVLPVEAVKTVRKRFPKLRFSNSYGPTENTTFTCCHTVADDWNGGPVPIGTPISNTSVYVVDGEQSAVPAGIHGELCCAGAGLARGYLGRPALTAERFVPNPFAEPGARMYRSGDRMRWCADGTLEFLGRFDQQVKIRGFRIEPGEIEAVLAGAPGVRDVRVILREDVPGDKRLVAYVAGTAEPEGLRAHLKQSLPEYMLPSAFVPLDRLPLTPNGKLDRKALPAPQYETVEQYLAPRTPVEEVLAGIWAEVLHRDSVGIGENFFGLGGHSLLAIRMVSRIREVFGVKLAVRELFGNPTIEELAKAVEGRRRQAPVAELPMTRVSRESALPLSFAEERLWFLDRLQPGSAVYNVPVALGVEGALDVPALERALGEVVRRHEVLRTAFREVDGSPARVIAPYQGFHLAVEDLSESGPEEREGMVKRRIGEEAAQPFDLAAGPLFRARLLRLDAQEHVLLLGMHHVVTDGWSLDVLMRELAALYRTEGEGGDTALAELPLQYADYAAWQRRQFQGETLRRELEYWKRQLSGAPAMLELPLDHPRTSLPNGRAARQRTRLSSELLGRLRALGRREGATLYMVLLGAVQMLLSKYSGSEDVVVGSPIAGRSRGELESLIGFFVNTLVLRTDLSGDPSFRELLGRVRETALGAYEHQELPFEKLVAELQPERSLAHSPLFQVMFQVHERAAAATPDLQGVRLRLMPTTFESTKYDLLVNFAPHPRGLDLVLTYGAELFEARTIERMLGHLAHLLDQIAANPDCRLSAFEVMPAEEKLQLEREWNQAHAPFPAQATIHELFEEQVGQTPDAIAVAAKSESLTYNELNLRANRLANFLIGQGVKQESRVAVLLDRSLELIVSFLAILKAGGVYVPLDPSYPSERLSWMSDNSAAAVLLTRRRFRARLPQHAAVIALEDAAAAAGAESPQAPETELLSRNLCYAMYTSGSTGAPKGVAIEHRSVVRLVRGANYAQLGSQEVVLQAAPVSFDASTLEIWGPLLNGGRLVLMGEAEPTLEELGGTLQRYGITTLWLTAGLFQAMVEARLEDFGGVRQLLAGGDVLPVEAVKKVRQRFPRLRLINGYGPTENTTFTCCHTVADEWTGGAVPIGAPISNTSVYVLDGEQQPVPTGIPGELYAAGAGLARGYLGRPALTAERFLPNPFGEPGGRMYRSGDRVRRRAGGTVEFLGRLDEQVKIRGFRIEPGEIEAALAGAAGIREARVIVREDGPDGKQLVAYVVGTSEPEGLRAHLRHSLPEYMLPKAFVRLERLPLTANGKLDRKALPAARFESETRCVAPRTPLEEVLAGIWAEVLNRDAMGIAENFFELGGHSLLAIRVISRIREVFGVKLAVRELFGNPTIEELAKAVEGGRRGEAVAELPMARVDRKSALPLSFAEERLWFLDRLQPGSAVYNVPAALGVEGALDVPALERALGEVVRRHEVLRTAFREVDGSPARVIAPYQGFHLAVEDLSESGPEEREGMVKRRIGEEAAQPFDLAAGPLFRARLLRLDAQEHVLLLGMHHVVTDGWSLDVLMRELAALYRTEGEGGDTALAELPLQYADYAAWQRRQFQGETLRRELEYWKRQLSGAPAMLELPLDHPRPDIPAYSGAEERIELPSELLGRLRALGRREGATLYMVLLAAVQMLLSKYSGSEDVVVGSPIAGRSRGELESLIGFFVNTLVLRTDLSGNPSFRELLRRVRETAFGAYEHQELPFEKLVAELQPERSLAHSPFFQVMFQVHEERLESRKWTNGLRLRRMGAKLQTTKYDLMLAFTANSTALNLVATYSTELFERTAIQRMLGRLERLLIQAATNPDAGVSDLQLMDAEERVILVEEQNRTEVEFPERRCIHQLFDDMEQARPDAIALVCGGRSLTYRELNHRANRLANHLVRHGAAVESRVGVLLQRGIDTIVALLAILKAGGAYLPLDASYPSQRLNLMLAHANADLLVTEECFMDGLSADVRKIAMDGAALAIAAESWEAPETDVTPRNLCYVMFTSGSTGLPKGVAVEHRGVVRLVRSANWVELGHSEVVLQSASISFDTSTFEIWGALLHGGRLVLPAESKPSLEQLGQTLRQEAVTTTWLTSGLFQLMVTEQLEDFQGVQQVVAGGDVVPVEAAKTLRRRFPELRLIDGYGPTENTTFTCCHTVTDRDCDGSIPIGSPISNTTVYILGNAFELVPRGLVGELYSGGAGVARGYLSHPALTADRFVPDPFAKTPGSRMYRTGDRVRWNENGAMVFLGRFDEQVKLRGFRIEPGEVVSAMERLPGVRVAQVILREDTPGDRRLVAYYAGDANSEWLGEQLRHSLPEYMAPSAFVRLESLPLSPNGKLDRGALPVPQIKGDGRAAPPLGDLEKRIAELWSTLLGVAEIGRTDKFFDLGGNSFLLYRVFSQLRKLRPDLRVVDLFRHTTVQGLARFLSPHQDLDSTEAAEGRARAMRRRAARRSKG